MFRKIFLFEIQNRIRRPAVYLYFAAALIFTIGTFATGSLPVGEKEHINSPYLISFWCCRHDDDDDAGQLVYYGYARFTAILSTTPRIITSPIL